MRRTLLPVLGRLAVLALFLLGATPVSAPPLSDRIDEILQRESIKQAFWGVAVYDLETGSTLYSRNVDQAFLPASNQKLITTATALDVLGSTYRFETSLHFDGTPEGSVIRGDFVLDGSGDPTFGSTEMRGEDPLRVWARRLADMGIERIEGRLIGDDDAFDDEPYPQGWTLSYITEQKGRYMGASASALSYRDNVVPLKVRATRPGAPPTVEVRPEGVVDVRNRAQTSSRWRGNTLQVNRTFSTNDLVLSGSVTRSYQGTLAVPVSDPTMFTLRSFKQHLQDAGIETDLTLHDIDALDREPPEGDPLFVEVSQPLSEIVNVLNKESNNFYAEQIFRRYGWGGSTEGASTRSKSFLRKADVNTRQLLIEDGSGLSRKNLITPQTMVKLLAHMNEHDERETFLASLPRGGEDQTTLERRLAGTSVRAKTGSLAFVRALSGYVTRPNGNRVAFAIFANNYTGPSYQISHAIDDIVQAISSQPS